MSDLRRRGWKQAVRFLNFLFDLIESISVELVLRFDEVCRISYKLDELAETALQGRLLRRQPSSSAPWPMGSTSSF